MMFKRKPKFRIITNEDGYFIVQELKPWSVWSRDGYVTKSYHYKLDLAEDAVERLANYVIAEYDYPPLVKMAL